MIIHTDHLDKTAAVLKANGYIVAEQEDI